MDPMRTKEVVITFVALLLLFIIGETLSRYNHDAPVDDLTRPTQQEPDPDSAQPQ
jgi:hypothetical protein